MKTYLSKPRAEILGDLAMHLAIELSTYGDDWEFWMDKSEPYKKQVEATINWMIEFSEKRDKNKIKNM